MASITATGLVMANRVGTALLTAAVGSVLVHAQLPRHLRDRHRFRLGQSHRFPSELLGKPASLPLDAYASR